MNSAQHILIFALRAYQRVLSPVKNALWGPLGCCRFTPTCSEYALEAVRIHGALSGGWLALRRLCRCHPWGGCGHDPVPRRDGEGRMGQNEGSHASRPSERAELASGWSGKTAAPNP